MRNYILLTLLYSMFFSCTEKPKNLVDVSGIQADFSIKRFEIDFYNADKNDLDQLKKTYPKLFPDSTPDSIWRAKINDLDERELFFEIQKVYENFKTTEKELNRLFKHVKYYHKKFEVPGVITVLNNIDYEYRVVYNDDLLYLSLDVYLGEESPFYADFPDYIKENNKQERIVVDVALKLIEGQITPSANRTFIGKMIAEGKKLYLLDLYLPEKSDHLKIGYSKEKLNWAIANESQVWRYFIEHDMLYSTDTNLGKRFLQDAPFSKFYLSEDSRSPGRIGQWMGWQIVRSFMEKNDVSLQTFLETSEEKIFEKSNYKPKE